MKKSQYLKAIGFIIITSVFLLNLHAQNPHVPIEKRGIVVYPSDIISLGAKQWVELLDNNHLNLLGIHADTRLETLPKLKSFLSSSEGQTLLIECKERNLDIEYELHVLQVLLPRSLFIEHPEYFRMDSNGKRQQDYNMCFTSDAAYVEIDKKIISIAKWLKPTTHRYFLWTDDVQNTFCKCEKCKHYSASEQALLYENRILSTLKKIDPEAQVAHLAYQSTLQAPKNVKPMQGVFLEYAPILRNYDDPLTEKHINDLMENLQVFPEETAHILEYWLDVSMFSGWQRDNLVKLPWLKEHVMRDVEDYRSLGLTSITSFGAWMNRDYMNQYGMDHIKKVLNDYGIILYNSEPVIIDGHLYDWDDNYYVNGLTDPWGLRYRDKTLFDYKTTDENFYFFFKVTDQSPTVLPFKEEQSVAGGDRVELFFSQKNNLPSYYCLEIDPNGNVLDYNAQYYRKFNEQWDFKSLLVETSVSENEYLVEGKISLRELRSLGLCEEIYLGIFRADYKSKEEVNWYTNKIPDSETPDFHIPSAFEKVSLKKYH